MSASRRSAIASSTFPVVSGGRDRAQEVDSPHAVTGHDRLTVLEGVDERRHVDSAEMCADGVGDGLAHEVLEDLQLAPLLAGLELDLAAQHLDHRLEIDDTRDRLVLAGDRRAVKCRGGNGFGPGDREAGRDTRTLVDGRVVAGVTGEPRQDLDDEGRDTRGEVGLLLDDGDLVVEFERVVRADLGAEAVLQRSDDATAVGVVLRVRTRHHEHVEREPQCVAADLDVALLHHVEHRDLDALGQIRQLVDRDDPAMCTRDEAEVDGLRIAQTATLGHLHRVDVADEVGHRGVGGWRASRCSAASGDAIRSADRRAGSRPCGSTRGG